ncbi:TlpA family protein disulfide reductase (plasmid) [Burkholderia thailandensis]|uniref:TlpA disulfide reductase family protein n=1 Tax=Burkholderia thailandensis TaxID=57975 RepID=UPI00192D854D|nr:TlpA disulfide reductase family protein [Burkholderia thailandensis]MBS2132142.1 TlpA family protein disulfide reductase [Burkholderia thailandensis]QRA15247.1 TlpA family protein disulfide reductase [Burkholderia thailandensis]
MVSLPGINITLARLILLVSYFATSILFRLVRRFTRNPSAYRYSRLLDEAIVCGLIFARLGYLIAHIDAYRTHPYEALFFWLPGYAPLYGLAGGFAWSLFRIQRNRATYINPGLFVAAALPLIAASLYLSLPVHDNIASKNSRVADALNSLPMTTVDGQPFTLKNLNGHSVVVNIWASWCLPCRLEIPILQDSYERYRKAGLIVVGLDLSETAPQASSYAHARGVAYVIASPDRDSKNLRTQIDQVIEAIGSNVIPVSVFVDASGKVRDVLFGILSPGSIDDWLRRYGI